MSAVWQPIETAPKDGQEIILFNPKEKGSHWPQLLIAYWRHDVAQGCWVHQGRACYGVGIAPTHWMPLPEAPTC